MQHCPNCGAGELKIIAAILKRPVIEKILKHLGLDPQPHLSPVRVTALVTAFALAPLLFEAERPGTDPATSRNDIP